MAKIRFKEKGEWREVEIQKYKSVQFVDVDDKVYELRPDKFGGIDIIANDGKIAVLPCMSNNVTISTI